MAHYSFDLNVMLYLQDLFIGATRYGRVILKNSLHFHVKVRVQP